MLKEWRHLCFSVVAGMLLCCNEPLLFDPASEVTFEVVDVGQGSAAIAVVNDSAMLFDVGPPEGMEQLLAEYRSLGEPPVAALFLSHDDRDHSGSLLQLCEHIHWSGRLMVSAFVDSASLVTRCSAAVPAVKIHRFGAGTTMTLGRRVTVRGLWPATNRDEIDLSVDSTANNLSLVVRISFDSTAVLLTGDIDSVVTRTLCTAYAASLQSDLLVVPHHGSRSAVDLVFYQYVRPSLAIISAGNNNVYGHPHQEVLSALTYSSIPFRTTALDGSMTWSSNGFYWTALF